MFHCVKDTTLSDQRLIVLLLGCNCSFSSWMNSSFHPRREKEEKKISCLIPATNVRNCIKDIEMLCHSTRVSWLYFFFFLPSFELCMLKAIGSLLLSSIFPCLSFTVHFIHHQIGSLAPCLMVDCTTDWSYKWLKMSLESIRQQSNRFYPGYRYFYLYILREKLSLFVTNVRNVECYPCVSLVDAFSFLNFLLLFQISAFTTP